MNHDGSQAVWMRGNDADQEAEAPEIVLPVVIVSPVPRFQSVKLACEMLAWGGNGNVVAEAGIAVLKMLTERSCLKLSKSS